MKSGKQRRLEINAKRKQKAAKRQVVNKETGRRLRHVLGPPVNEALLAPNNSYGAPDFVYRGYYVDISSSSARGRIGVTAATTFRGWTRGMFFTVVRLAKVRMVKRRRNCVATR